MKDETTFTHNCGLFALTLRKFPEHAYRIGSLLLTWNPLFNDYALNVNENSIRPLNLGLTYFFYVTLSP